ncbi:MAG TPA: cytochrome c peroxidase [Kofleriaceae bacterium]|nr:cytochrome c peroxidase [Kofleriaceae bacterium]
MRNVVVALGLLAACKKGGDDKAAPKPVAAPDGGATASSAGAIPATTATGPVELPAAPPVPPSPMGLPALPTDHAPTANEVALGALLFHDPRLAANGTTSCASCHDPHNGYSSVEAHPRTSAGKPNLRRAPALVNLAWQRELGWDGRATDRPGFLDAHVVGQLGHPLEVGLGRILGSATYRAHFDRAAGGRDRLATATSALWTFVATRYSGAAPWDRYEAGDTAAVPPEVVEGYKVYNGVAQCSTCHAPPLYTDLAFHRLGLAGPPDEGRGRSDPAQAGAFKTPTLRGAAGRRPLFHDGSAATLDDAVTWHLGGGRASGTDAAADAGATAIPALTAVTLTPDERAALVAFLNALTPAPDAAAVAPPALPGDVPPGAAP